MFRRDLYHSLSLATLYGYSPGDHHFWWEAGIHVECCEEELGPQPTPRASWSAAGSREYAKPYPHPLFAPAITAIGSVAWGCA